MNKTIIETIANLLPSATLVKKENKEFYANAKDILCTLYEVYRGRESGKPANESEAMAKVTEFLHTIGKANGKFISVMEKTENGERGNTLFETLVYHSFRHDVITTSATLADLQMKAQKASKEAREAHEALLNGSGSAEAYKAKAEALTKARAKVEAEKQKINAQKDVKRIAKESTFTKLLILELKAIAQKRFAMTEEEVKAQRAKRNAETKKKRKSNAKPTEAKAEAKKPAPKKPAKTEAKPAETVKKSA